MSIITSNVPEFEIGRLSDGGSSNNNSSNKNIVTRGIEFIEDSDSDDLGRDMEEEEESEEEGDEEDVERDYPERSFMDKGKVEGREGEGDM